MMALKHYIKIVVKILTSRYRYSKTNLLLSYLRLQAKSITYHKLRAKRPGKDIKSINLLGLSIHFFEYHQIIDLFEEIFIFQVYDFNSSKFDPLIFDCGSNIGMSVLYFKTIFPSCRIHAFEPDHETFLILKKNVAANNLKNVITINTALSNFSGHAYLYNRKGENGSLNTSMLKPLDEVGGKLVPTEKLSSFILDKIDALKIDVEGSEVNIIDDLIQNNKLALVEKMLIEYHPTITNITLKQFEDQITLQNFVCEESRNDLHEGATEKMIYCMNRILINIT